MTGLSKKSLGHRGFAGFARLLLLVTVSICAMASWGPTPVEAYYFQQASLLTSSFLTYEQRLSLYLEQRLTQYIEQRLSQYDNTLSARVSALQNTMTGQTGVVDFSLCPGFKDASSTVITTCVTSPSAGAGTSVTDVNVTFATPFTSPPVVGVAYSGLSFLTAKNCTLEVLDVQTNQFTIRQFADDFLPIDTQATFFACP